MKEKGCDFLLVTSEDCHMSEYVCDRYRTIEHYSGFTGSDGDMLLTSEKDYLWTDGRYFIQAENELRGTGIRLMRMGEPDVPEILDFIKDNIKTGQTLFFDYSTVSLRRGCKLEKIVEDKGASVVDSDIAGDEWEDRPSLPSNKVFVLPDHISGKTAEEKIQEVKNSLSEKECDGILITSLDEICWLLNIRGRDIACNPVAMSSMYISGKKVILFIQKSELDEDAMKFIGASGAEIRPYEEFRNFIEGKTLKGQKTLLDRFNTSFYLYKTISGHSEAVVDRSPVGLMKAVKNETELTNLRRIYIEDSAALTKTLLDLKEELPHDGKTEAQVAGIVDIARSHLKGFIEPSFPTIVAYGANAAMMHYEPDREKSAEILDNGLLLIDSGGQYMGGTTDVTRTVSIGNVSDTIRKLFTRTVAGMLNLADTVFLEGCTGINLDIMARGPLWKMLSDYKCGTGHGVGYMLNVHEGPHSIRWKSNKVVPDEPFKEGMIVSDEPGVYRDGEFGIRIENILELVSAGESADGKFLKFRHLTYVPIDLDVIDIKYMTDEDIRRLNEYHELVLKKLLPYMDGRYAQLLMEATRPVSR